MSPSSLLATPFYRYYYYNGLILLFVYFFLSPFDPLELLQNV